MLADIRAHKLGALQPQPMAFVSPTDQSVIVVVGPSTDRYIVIAILAMTYIVMAYIDMVCCRCQPEHGSV